MCRLGTGTSHLSGTSRSGGGGNRTRVLQLLNEPSPSAAGSCISGPEPPPAITRDPSHPLLSPGAGQRCPSGESYWMTPVPDP